MKSTQYIRPQHWLWQVEGFAPEKSGVRVEFFLQLSSTTFPTTLGQVAQRNDFISLGFQGSWTSFGGLANWAWRPHSWTVSPPPWYVWSSKHIQCSKIYGQRVICKNTWKSILRHSQTPVFFPNGGKSGRGTSPSCPYLGLAGPILRFLLDQEYNWIDCGHLLSCRSCFTL